MSKRRWNVTVGRVFVDTKSTFNTRIKEEVPKATIASCKQRMRRRALGLPERRETPVSDWRVSRYRAKGMKKPKHPRVRLREKVAREHREIQEQARQYARAGIDIAAQIMGDPTQPASARLQAIEIIASRAYGRPNQTNTNLNVDANGKPREVSSTELDRRIEEALGAVEAITGRANQKAKGKEQPADLCECDRNPDGSEPQLH
jgi:hypothetical protein